jgi:hypothetical protein
MAYDESLAQRVRRELAALEGVSERRMFGGLCFMLHGNMALGIDKERLMVRVGPKAYKAALQKPHARPMDMTGRPMKGFVVVPPEGVAACEELQGWVGQEVDFALSLPPK